MLLTVTISQRDRNMMSIKDGCLSIEGLNLHSTLPQQLFLHTVSPSPSRLRPVRNDGFVKPRGGMWTSPIRSYSWKSWCEDNEFRDDLPTQEYTLTPVSHARVVVIDSVYDLEVLLSRFTAPQDPQLESLMGKVLDFEALSSIVDGIHLTERGQWRTRLSTPNNLYGWDVESVLWFRWVFEEYAE